MGTSNLGISVDEISFEEPSIVYQTRQLYLRNYHLMFSCNHIVFEKYCDTNGQVNNTTKYIRFRPLLKLS